MGILDWMFGHKPSSKQTQDPGGELAWDFRKSERPSDRNWRWHLKDVGGQRVALGIAGINYRLTDVTKYVSAAHRAKESNSRYGILLVREPDNPVDPNAIRVMGWIDDPSRSTQLGYLHREDVERITKEFPVGTPLAAELWRVYSPNPDKLWVGIRLLIPSKSDPWWQEQQE